LGIECGATKTIALLETGAEGEVSRGEFGPGNLRLLDDAALRAHFQTIHKYFDRPGNLAAVAIGMAGARTDADRRRMRQAADVVWPGVECHATNDLAPALAAAPATDADARILVLSGTGSCCFGEAGDRTLRYGGWGHILGDRGSGYEIGLNALKAVIHAFDANGQWPALGQRFLQALVLNEPDDLIDWVKRAEKAEVAALAVDVFAAAAKRDPLARAVVDAAAKSLAHDGAQCASRLIKRAQTAQFVLAGSVLVRQPAFAARVRGCLLELWPKAEVVTLEREAVWGALALVRREPSTAAKVTGKRPGILPKLTALSPTERRNPRSMKLHELSADKAIALMIEEETSIGPALRKVRPQIELALELIVAAFERKGRLFYVGAGTSGRLGVLDASECPPTFRVSREQVQGIIAGGQTALWSAVEGMEDDPHAGARAIEFRGVGKKDVVVGIAASGRTPFVWGALAEGKKRGAKTVLLCFNPHLEIPPAVVPDVVIAADVGPEVLTGSTRLKSGTATKIVLNTLTTLAMVRLGKVLSNLMVDLNPSNEKLRERAVRIVREVTGVDETAALAALEKAQWVVKTACETLTGAALPVAG
jgi:N-acetylmuramic acid 6-phosphate etherase